MRHLPGPAQRGLHWWRSRDIGAGEIIIAPLLIIAAIAFHKLTPAQIQQLATYRSMDGIASFYWWEGACLLMAVAIIAGAVFNRPITAAVGFLASSILFLTIGVIIWRVSHTYLTPALYLAFGLGAAKRAGELVGKWAAGNGNSPD